MRTWQELTEAAEATGTFANYVGDGFSVPWQTYTESFAPLGFTLWAYKAHLDARYFPASKLHDWCYTPYGSLIQVTRAEADLALRDYMRAIGGSTSEIDSAIVYLAVDLGGERYFGTSQTGFDQGVYLEAVQRISGIVSGPNIPSAGTVRRSGIGQGVYFVGDPTVAIKAVIVFQQTTLKGISLPNLGLAGRQHMAGWTEHVWYPSDSVSALMDALTKEPGPTGDGALLNLRARLLCNQGTILGVRLYQGGAGKGQFRAASFPGAAGTGDIPSMGLLCYAQLANSLTPKRITFRGLPDAAVDGGEYIGTPDMNQILGSYGRCLAAFGAVGADAVTAFPVFSISAAGIVTLNGVNNPFAVGNVVTFRNVLIENTGQRVGGQFVVAAVGPMNTQFSLTGWPAVNATGGDVRIPTSSVHGIVSGSLTVSRIVTRKVGRPFELYRGRRSNRPRAA